MQAVSTLATNRSLKFDLIAIGASTGGTEAVRKILCELPAILPPLVITVHMPAGFTSSFAKRLNDMSCLNVHEASHGQDMLPGHAYVAPGDFHLKVKKYQGRYQCHIDNSDKVSGHRPSVDALFASVATEAGPAAVGVLLTGMGKDGAQGLLSMKQKQGLTLIQDEASSVVYGMPREAALLNAHCEQLHLDAMSKRLVEHIQ